MRKKERGGTVARHSLLGVVVFSLRSNGLQIIPLTTILPRAMQKKIEIDRRPYWLIISYLSPDRCRYPFLPFIPSLRFFSLQPAPCSSPLPLSQPFMTRTTTLQPSHLSKINLAVICTSSLPSSWDSARNKNSGTMS